MADLAYDPTTSLGRIRMLCWDTDATAYILSDAEITALLALNGNDVYSSAADGLRSIAAGKARVAMLFNTLAANFKVDRREIPKLLLQIADAYEEKAGQDDTTDYFIEWGMRIHPRDGRVETDRRSGADEDDPFYDDIHYWHDGN